MEKHILVVMTNAVEGQDDQFNDWYTSIHLPDALRVPGFVAAQRFRVAHVQGKRGVPPYRYLAIYELATDDLEASIRALTDAVASMRMDPSLADDRLVGYYSPITDRVTSAEVAADDSMTTDSRSR